MPGDRVHENITDRAFRLAVDLMDAGDCDGLRAHLDAHPGAVNARVDLGQQGYFANPSLMAFIAENPVRHGRVPANILDVLDVMIDSGADQSTLDETLGLVASGRVMREAGVQSDMIVRLCAEGAEADGAMLAALSHGEFTAVAALVKAGATRTLPWAAATGAASEVARLLPEASAMERHQALALAALHGHAAPLKLILSAGEDPDRFNPSGCHAHTTALHQAAFYGHDAAVRVLVDAGARYDIADKSHGGTAADWAHHGGHSDIKTYLSGLATNG